MECHSSSTTVDVTGAGSIALVGHPIVGKTVLFQRLTGQRVTVSNYPGTTVEIAREPPVICRIESWSIRRA